MGKRKIAMVTGAGKGIGAAVALRLARDGFDIWLNYRADHAGARKVREKVEKAGSFCRLLPYNVSDAVDTRNVLGPLLEEQTPYSLVNNAGITRDGVMGLMSVEDWRDVLSVSLDGFFHTTKMMVKAMLRKREGRIVNISSTSGQSGVPGQVNYSAAKAGLIGATKALAAEVARRNILVNAVAPGFIETSMTSMLPREKILPGIPQGRFGTPDEVAAVVGFLCSEDAAYITGQVIGVNGGIYM